MLHACLEAEQVSAKGNFSLTILNFICTRESDGVMSLAGPCRHVSAFQGLAMQTTHTVEFPNQVVSRYAEAEGAGEAERAS